MVFNCLHSQAPQYFVELCQPVAGVASRQRLRSATQQLLVVPRHQLSSYGRRAFCVVGPSVWNYLPDSLRDPTIGGNSFRQFLKTFLFATYCCIQRINGFTTNHDDALYTSTFYLLTYLLTRTVARRRHRLYMLIDLQNNDWLSRSMRHASQTHNKGTGSNLVAYQLVPAVSFTMAELRLKQPATNKLHTIRYDSVYLTCSKKLTGSQLSLSHGMNKKLKCKTKKN